LNQLLETNSSPSAVATAAARRVYSLYGLTIRSEVPLTYPKQNAADEPDVQLQWASEKWFAAARQRNSEADIFNGWYDYAVLDDGSVFVRYPGYCQFVVSPDGNQIACGLLENATSEWFQTYLLGAVLSFALLKKGEEPLHATAVIVNGEAIAFSGDSGRGKSTLATSFMSAGYPLLTDDLLRLRSDANALIAFPGPSRLKLLPDTAAAFERGRGVAPDPEGGKLILGLGPHEAHRDPVPLRALYVLERPVSGQSDVEIRNLSRSEAFVALVANTFNTQVTDPDRLSRQFTAARAIVDRLPVRSLSYPRQLELLPQVRDQILEGVSVSL